MESTPIIGHMWLPKRCEANREINFIVVAASMPFPDIVFSLLVRESLSLYF